MITLIVENNIRLQFENDEEIYALCLVGLNWQLKLVPVKEIKIGQSIHLNKYFRGWPIISTVKKIYA
jgi:hypothetical protein